MINLQLFQFCKCSIHNFLPGFVKYDCHLIIPWAFFQLHYGAFPILHMGASESYQKVFDKTKTYSGKAKPKAVAVPKRTPAENRPFIAGGGLGSLKDVNGLSKGMPGNGEVNYGIGDRVKHVKYGEGTVMKLEKGPRDYQVTVVFDSSSYSLKSHFFMEGTF